jgi:hypothetical protein
MGGVVASRAISRFRIVAQLFFGSSVIGNPLSEAGGPVAPNRWQALQSAPGPVFARLRRGRQNGWLVGRRSSAFSRLAPTHKASASQVGATSRPPLQDMLGHWLIRRAGGNVSKSEPMKLNYLATSPNGLMFVKAYESHREHPEYL